MRLTFSGGGGGGGQEIGLAGAFQTPLAIGPIHSARMMNQLAEIGIASGQRILGAEHGRSVVAGIVTAGFFEFLRVGNAWQSEFQVGGCVVRQPGFGTALGVGHNRVDGAGIKLEVAVRERGFGAGAQRRIGKV